MKNSSKAEASTPIIPAEVRENEQLLATYLLNSHLVVAEQIQDARDSQALALEFGRFLPLGEILVKAGVITAVQRANIEKHIVQEIERSRNIGPFRLIKLLGAGAMGKVYEAEDSNAKRRIALKVLAGEYAKSPHFLQRFQNEAKALGKLNHPNIVAAYDVGEDNGRYYVVMELCDGQSLEVLLKDKKPLPPALALDYTRQIARGLEHAHARGLIHRDIKPGNILVNQDGTAKILDLGLSKNMDVSDGYTTAAGMAVGTPHYMSPEQARGSADTDLRTDIYSLGVTLFHFLTGQPPFIAKTPEKIMAKHLKERAPKPSEIVPEVPACIDALVERMMAKKPEDRYPNCAALEADLKRVMVGKMPLPLEQVIATAARKQDSAAKLKGISSHGSPAVVAPTTSHSRIELRNRANQSDSNERLKNAGHVPMWKTPHFMYGAGAAAVVVAAYFFFFGGPEQTSNALPANTEAIAAENPAQSQKTEAPKPEALTKTEVAAKPVQAPKPAAKEGKPYERKKINLLEGVNAGRDAVAGIWYKTQEGLACDRAPGARLEISYSPPEEYDIRAAFTRLDGTDGVMLVGSIKGQNFAWKIGDHNNTISAIETINGAPSYGNSTTKRLGAVIETGKRTTALIEVRNNSIKAFLNGQPMVQLNTEGVTFGMVQQWKMRDGRLLGIGSWNTKTIFHELEVVEISGPGRIFR